MMDHVRHDTNWEVFKSICAIMTQENRKAYPVLWLEKFSYLKDHLLRVLLKAYAPNWRFLSCVEFRCKCQPDQSPLVDIRGNPIYAGSLLMHD